MMSRYGIHPTHLRRYVVRPTLQILEYHSLAAENLIMGTIAHESRNGAYLHQIGGPALGIAQVEPATHTSQWLNYLSYRMGSIGGSVWQLASEQAHASATLHTRDDSTRVAVPDEQELVWNLRYAVAHARVWYLRVPESLPAPDDVTGLAEYHKTYYNTRTGSARVEDFRLHYERMIAAENAYDAS